MAETKGPCSSELALPSDTYLPVVGPFACVAFPDLQSCWEHVSSASLKTPMRSVTNGHPMFPKDLRLAFPCVAGVCLPRGLQSKP